MIRYGVDRAATLALKTQLCSLMKYRWRCVMTGAVATMPRLYKMGRVDSPICPACGQEEETTEHIFVRCPAYAAIRNRELPQQTWDLMPDCLRNHGIIPCGLVLPDEDNNAEGRAGLAGTVQYAQLDMLEARQQYLPAELAPRPRWERRVRARVDEQAAAGQPPGEERGPVFVRGGELRTANGEHLR